MTTSTYHRDYKKRGIKRGLRPAWTGVNIAIMILGFIIAWPIGLFMIAYMIWGRDWGLDLSDWDNLGRKADRAQRKMHRAFGDAGAQARPTGNRAFDEWRDAELERLAKERQSLDEAQQEFDNYVEELRRARDKEEFDKFYGGWQSRKKNSPDTDDIIDVTPG